MSGLKVIDDMKNRKFYCTIGDPGWLTKGKIYETDGMGRVMYDNGHIGSEWNSFADYSLAHRLVPLVARKAFPGDWVYVNSPDERVPPECNGDVFEVKSRACFLDGAYLAVPEWLCVDSWRVLDNEYLVLDGYKPDKTESGKTEPADTPALTESAPTKPKQDDSVHSPSHYADKQIEVIDYIRDTLTHDEFVGYCCGNVIKYISRWRKKGGAEDLRKAEVYLGWAEEAVRGKK